ncbi:MAG: DUF5615 family PIN-like protein [Actinomycetota bacterium]|nr:DUF5615 family PIN-like protein [Actinomycetota bacterium]
MKALLDERLSPQITILLRQERHDVCAVAERDDLVGRSDRMILEVASAEDRAVIANNIKDFRPLAAEWLAQGRTHPGLILMPSARTRSRSAIPALADAIASILCAHPDEMRASERWVGPLETGEPNQ